MYSIVPGNTSVAAHAGVRNRSGSVSVPRESRSYGSVPALPKAWVSSYGDSKSVVKRGAVTANELSVYMNRGWEATACSIKALSAVGRATTLPQVPGVGKTHFSAPFCSRRWGQ